jgi:outer membrane protein TolC
MGQAGAEESLVLGLDELIEMALRASPEISEREQDILAAESDLAQARAAQWAQLDAAAVGGVVDDAEKPVVKITPQKRTQTGTWIVTVEEGRDSDETDLGPFGRLELTVVQPIYTFGKIINRKKAAAHGLDVERASLEQTRGEIILKVKELYFSHILANQGKEAAQDTNTFIESARERVQRLLELGATTVDESDLYRLEAYAADAKRAMAKAVAGARLTNLALKRTIGLPDDQDFEMDLKELPTDSRALADQEEYIQKALRWRPEFQQIERGLMARRHLVEAANADLYPTLFAAAVGTLAGAPGREHLAEPYIGDKFNKADFGAVLGAKWHFDLGITRAKVSKARAEYQRLIHTKELAQRDIPLEVARYYQEALEHQVSFQSYSEASAAARKWIVVSFANFDMGVGSLKDILLAVERYGENQSDYLRSLLRYHLALAKLSYAIGEYRPGTS